MNINDMMKVVLANLNEVLADENSLNCANRLKLKKAESLIQLVNHGMYVGLSDLYWGNDQFHSIADSFLANGNNEHYCFYFLADEGEKILTVGKVDPVLLFYVLEDIQEKYKEVREHDKSNNHD